jgi:hypothetical protein
MLAYAEVLVTKKVHYNFSLGRMKPIDRPHLATWLDISERANNFESGRCNHFGRAHIDLSGIMQMGPDLSSECYSIWTILQWGNDK